MALNLKMAKKKFGTPRVPLKLTPTPERGPAPSVSVRTPTLSESVRTPALSERAPVPERVPSVSVRTPALSERTPVPERVPSVSLRTPALSERTPVPERAPSVSVRTPALSERSAALWKRTAALWTRTPSPSERTPVPERAPTPDRGPRRYHARINRAPVLDRTRVQELAGQVQSQGRLLEFLNLFLVLLPSRVASVVSALEGKDSETASAAARSLASSAAMAGASRLELVALLVDFDLRAGRMDRARETGRRLGSDASELASALSCLLTGA
jgi:HPt (histidine-containing phosphotransfer) domain-containing protein